MLLTEHESKRMLDSHGINVNQTYFADSEDVAVKLAEKIGYPVVMKVVGRKISHKSEVGGVILNISNGGEVRESFRRMSEIPGFEGVTIQKMEKKGIEVLVGVFRDSELGHVITFGSGGVLVELLRDVSFGVLPLEEKDAVRIIKSTKVYKLLEGYRGYKGNTSAVVDLIMRVSKLVCENPEISEMDLNPVFVYEDGYVVVDARIVLDEVRENEYESRGGLENFFNPRSVAVFGSFKMGKAGFTIAYNLVNLGYKGRIYPVSLQGDEIFGLKIYRTVEELPETPDVAVIATPAETVPEVMRAIAKKGTRSVVIISSGFREESEKGAKLEDDVVRIAKEHGMRVIGPNTTGIYNPESGFTSSFAILKEIKRGNIGIIAQTGLFLGILMNHIATSHPSIGFSKIVGLGNKCDVQDHEILDLMLQDDSTKAIGMYVEGFKNGRAFLRSARKAMEKQKPIVIFKAGRTDYGKKMAMSHSASIAGNDEVFSAVCDQLNLIRVFSYEEIIEVLKAITLQPLPRGNRLAILHYVGSGCVQGADEAYFGGLKLPEMSEKTARKISEVTPEWHRVGNPFDIWPSIEYFGVDKAYNTSLKAVLEDDVFDCVVVGTWAVEDLYPVYKPSFDLIKKYGKPVYFFLEGDRNAIFNLKNEYESNGFPVFSDIVTTIRVLSKVVRYSLRLKELMNG
jgi:acyl-CoA synthetase (NDP forming)